MGSPFDSSFDSITSHGDLSSYVARVLVLSGLVGCMKKAPRLGGSSCTLRAQTCASPPNHQRLLNNQEPQQQQANNDGDTQQTRAQHFSILTHTYRQQKSLPVGRLLVHSVQLFPDPLNRKPLPKNQELDQNNKSQRDRDRVQKSHVVFSLLPGDIGPGTLLKVAHLYHRLGYLSNQGLGGRR